VDPQGRVWVTLMNVNELARLDPVTGEWKLFAAPTQNAGPHGLVSDSGGNIWFTENTAGKIGRVDARTGSISEFSVPGVGDPHTPVFGPDGALWFTAEEANSVTRMDTQNGQFRSYLVPTPKAAPYGLVAGPDGGLWFCEFGANKLGRIDPATGAITEFTAPEADARPRQLVVVGAALYFTDFAGGRMGRFDIGSKKFQFWPSPSDTDAKPYGINADATGMVWYCEVGSNRLMRFDPRMGLVQSFPLPSANSYVRSMVRDARGRIWMALSGANKVAVIE
jgi:virginiamycin B lyase